jgi:predicted permease
MMSILRGITELWLQMTRRPASDDLDREMQAHLQIEIDENIENGMTPEEARYAAQKKFGNALLHRERTEDVWRFAWLDSLLWDIRYAVRGFRNSPGFAFTVIGTLALGLGSLAVFFGMFNTMVLRPFAVRDPHSLYGFVGWESSKGSAASVRGVFTRREFLDFRRNNPVFSEILGYQDGMAPMAGRWAGIQAVTGNYFTMLGGSICLGRPLLDRDDESSEGVAVASYTAWKTRLGADPDIIGKKVRLNKRPVEIVGVACREFNGPQLDRIDFWVSLALSGELSQSDHPIEFPRLSILGRLKPELNKANAEAALLAYGRNQYLTWQNWQRPERAYVRQRATVMPLDRNAFIGCAPIFVLFGLVLFTACANVANIMLARGLARRREIDIRISLGAGRVRMIRQLLTESLLLAIVAALVSFCVGYGIIRGIDWLVMSILPSLYMRQSGFVNVFRSFLPDLRVLGFLIVTALITIIFFGLIPAIRTTRSSLKQANRGDSEAGGRSVRFRCALVIVQAIFCTLLLVLSATAMHNGMRILSMELGLDTHGVFSIKTSEKYRRPVLDRLSSLPAVASISTCIKPPMDFWFGRIPFFHPRFSGGNEEIQCHAFAVSPEYFDIYKIAIRGRRYPTSPLNLSEYGRSGSQDGTDVIISETAARHLWPAGDALGRTIEERRPDPKSGKTIALGHTIVGIAGDSVTELYDYTGALEPNRAVVYFLAPPVSQHVYLDDLLVRMQGNAAVTRLSLQKALDEATPGEMYYEITSAKEEMNRILFSYRFLAALEGFLGAMALLMTALGVFGMQSYMVAQRKKEFGIRMALGADKGRVTGMVLRQSLLFTVTGSLLGSLLAMAVARLLEQSFRRPDSQSLLWDADSYAFDPGGYAAGILIVIIAALAASWIPAKKAVNLDPARTLHCD